MTDLTIEQSLELEISERKMFSQLHVEALQREAMLRAALSDAIYFIKNRHNMGRGVREARRLEVMRNVQEVLDENANECLEEKK